MPFIGTSIDAQLKAI